MRSMCLKRCTRTGPAAAALAVAFLVPLAGPRAAADIWRFEIVDLTADVGAYSSLVLRPAGQPAIAYYNQGQGDLKYAWRDGDGWHTVTVDSAGYVGEEPSLALLPAGQPAISYYDVDQGDVKYAWFDGTDWQREVVDSEGEVGTFGTSLAVLPTGEPAVSYRDHSQGTLKYAWRAGGVWQHTVVDASGNVGHYSSLVVLPTGQPAISYLDYSNDRLKYAWFDGAQWHAELAVSPGGQYTSLALLPDGRPALVHNPAWELRYAWFDGDAWQETPIDSVSGFESWFGAPGLSIGSDGRAAIAYVRRQAPAAPELRCAMYDGGSWQIQPLAPANWGESSLAFQRSGTPAISYPGVFGLYFAAQFGAGDLNCDGAIDAFDIDPFVLALTDPGAYGTQYPECDRTLADVSGDGKIDAFDIDPFVALLAGK